jgi:nucleoside-diphosphate-sugar epimerase
MGVQPFWACDSSRAVNELGWQPGDDLSVRVAQTVEWYKSAGWL